MSSDAPLGGALDFMRLLWALDHGLSTRARLLLWSSVCFVGLAINNILLFVDLIVVPDVDLSLVRGVVALASVVFINFGLIWDSK